MSARSLLALALTAALALAAVWWFRGEPEADPPGERAKLFPDLDPDAAVSVSLRSSRGIVDLVRDESGWTIRAPETDEADPERVDALLGTLAGATALREIAAAGEDPAPFGLGEPLAEARVTFRGGSAVALRLGRASPVGFERYAATTDGGAVVLVDGSIGTALERSAEAFRQMRLVPIATGALRAMRFERAGTALEMVREGNGWRITAPVDDRADEGIAGALARTVTGMTLRRRAPGPDAKSEGAVRIRVEAEGVDPVEVLLAPSEDGESARGLRLGSAVSGILDGWVLEELSRPPEAFRDREITRFSAPDVRELRFAGPGAAFSVRRSREGAPWILSVEGEADREADAAAVERAVDALRWLRAIAFPPGAAADLSGWRCEIFGERGSLGWVAWSDRGDERRVASSWREGILLAPEAGALEGLPSRPEDLLPSAPTEDP